MCNAANVKPNPNSVITLNIQRRGDGVDEEGEGGRSIPRACTYTGEVFADVSVDATAVIE